MSALYYNTLCRSSTKIEKCMDKLNYSVLQYLKKIIDLFETVLDLTLIENKLFDT